MTMPLVPNVRMQKFQIDLQMFGKSAAEEVFLFWWDWRRIRIEWWRYWLLSSFFTCIFKFMTSENKSRNKTLISIQVTYYNQYLVLKPKDSEEFILNQRLMKGISLENISLSLQNTRNSVLRNSGFTTELS